MTLKGKIIKQSNDAAAGLKISAYNRSYGFVANDMIGETSTDSNGYFRFDFDDSALGKFPSLSDLANPRIYLVVDCKNGKLLKTKLTPLTKEIEYHIKLSDNLPIPNVVDIYAHNTSRIINTLNQIGTDLGVTKIDIDSLVNGNLPSIIKDGFKNLLGQIRDASSNFDSISAVFSGVLNSSLREHNLGTIGYDGPQVPRNPWRRHYDHVIIWPRKEKSQ